MLNPVSSRWLLWAMNLLSIAGVVLSAIMTRHFYDLRNGTAGFKSFCNLAASFNCDQVALSRYAELFWGIPLSSLALGWYLGFFFISLLGHRIFWRREVIRAAFVLSSIAVSFSLPYVGIMAFQLKTFCLFCLILDGISLLLWLGVTLGLKPEGLKKQPLDRGKWKVFFPILGTTLVLTLFFSKSLGEASGLSRKLTAAELQDMVQSVLQSPRLEVKTSPEFPSLGPSSAPITIVEFSDFQCPFCKIAAYALNSALLPVRDQVRVEFRNFPLDSACNPKITSTFHPVACEAAQVALCAHRQGRFESVYETLFDHQSSFAPGKPLELATQLGLHAPELQSCMSSPQIALQIEHDIQEASVLGVNSTPTFFVNGYKVEGALPVEFWNALFQQWIKNQ